MLFKERTVNAPLIGHFLTNIASWNIFINSNNVYYRWSKEFLEAGKKRLAGDTTREASSDEVVDLKKENKDLKQVVAELYLRNNWLKKSLTGQGVTLDDD